jgi:hypothetical protein
MSLAKALHPNRRLRQNNEGRPPGFVRLGLHSEFPLKKIGLARNNSSQPGVAIPVKTSAGNNRDNDDGCDNSGARHASSKAGNRNDNKVYSNTGTDYSSRKGNIRRNSPDRTRY